MATEASETRLEGRSPALLAAAMARTGARFPAVVMAVFAVPLKASAAMATEVAAQKAAVIRRTAMAIAAGVGEPIPAPPLARVGVLVPRRRAAIDGATNLGPTTTSGVPGAGLQEGQGRLAGRVTSTVDPSTPSSDAGPEPEEGVRSTGRSEIAVRPSSQTSPGRDFEVLKFGALKGHRKS